MKFLKKTIKNENFLPLLIVLVLALLAGKGLIGQGYFNMHDDLQMMRQLEMEKCFLSLQLPCRWVPDMGYGFGFPLFNYYPPLPYLFGEIFRLFGIAFVDTVKLTFLFAILASGISMYFLGKEFFGKWGGVLSSVFYIWAPYHSVDIYVRGAMNEAWGIIWFPAILLSTYKLLSAGSKFGRVKAKHIIGLSLSWCFLLLSHNLMALIFAPFFAVWCVIWIIKTKKITQSFVNLATAGMLSLGLAAFFTLPVALEQNLVQTQTLIQGYYDYSAHFATIKQLLFSRFWGYGPSIWGANDGLSFQVGYLHWIIPILTICLTILTFLKKRKIEDWMLTVVYFFAVGWFAIFMIHNKSTPLWLHINTLRFVQFPWRFLTLVILSFSFTIGSVTKFTSQKYFNTVLIFLLSAVLLYSWNYFEPQDGKLGALTDQEKFTGEAWELQQTAGIYDYLPVTAKTAPKSSQKYLAEVAKGEAVILNTYESTNFGKFDVNATKDSEIRIGIFQFPNWKTFVDGNEVPNFIDKDEEWGRMYINVPEGNHHVEVRFYNTPIRTIGNILSLVSWIGLICYLLIRRYNPFS